MGERHLDYVDAKERRVRILSGHCTGTTRELLRRADRRAPRYVDVNVGGVFGVGHDSVSVRAPTRLHDGEELRMADVGDVENADSADALAADSVRNSLHSAIDSRVR